MILIWWYISDFFDFIFDTVSSVIGWIVSVISLITSCVGFLGDLFLALPTIFKISLIALVAISVIYKILGREGK